MREKINCYYSKVKEFISAYWGYLDQTIGIVWVSNTKFPSCEQGKDSWLELIGLTTQKFDLRFFEKKKCSKKYSWWAEPQVSRHFSKIFPLPKFLKKILFQSPQTDNFKISFYCKRIITNLQLLQSYKLQNYKLHFNQNKLS